MLDSDVVVGTDAFADVVFDVVRDPEALVEVGLGAFFVAGVVVAELVLDHFEVAFCERARFADADIVEHGASLDALQVLDEDVVIFHIVSGQSHGNRDGERQTFWDDDDQEHNGDDEYAADFEDGGSRKEDPVLGEDDEPEEENRVGYDADGSRLLRIVTDVVRNRFQSVFQKGMLL